ncbi:hypothetical protein DSM112329_01783 [Paraconexibacter sp. AEG42_29]|uniref:Calx-beta domain-containing protein n=1 Tax=Paraconexibacter sp. AEG42_29 TaxID=2997339 RepID=A0AAU7ATG5_9ACTN
MRLRRTAVPAFLAVAALGTSALTIPPAPALAGDPAAGGFTNLLPLPVRDMTVFENDRLKSQVLTLRCDFDVCDYWIGPRDGTAKALKGDFNPFRVTQVDLTRGQTRKVKATVQALKDDVYERDESFSLAVVQSVQDAGHPWVEVESRGKVTLRNTTPQTIKKADVTKVPCYRCAG